MSQKTSPIQILYALYSIATAVTAAQPVQKYESAWTKEKQENEKKYVALKKAQEAEAKGRLDLCITLERQDELDHRP